MFTKTVGRNCTTAACPVRGQLVQPHLVLCDECGVRLTPVTVVDRKTALIAAAVAVVVLAGAAAGAKAYVVSVAARKEAELLGKATSLARSSLGAATKGEAEKALASVARQLGLTDGQRSKLAASMRNDVAKLPDDFTSTLQQEIDRLVRAALDEGAPLSPSDVRIAAFIGRNHLRAAPVQSYVTETTARAQQAADAITTGKHLAAAGRIDDAFEAFTEATKADPRNAFAWANLGAAAVLRNDTAGGESAYKRALELDRDNWLANYNYGLLLARGGKNNEALAHLDAAMRQLRRQEAAVARLDAVRRNLRNEDALKELRNDPRFRGLVAAN